MLKRLSNILVALLSVTLLQASCAAGGSFSTTRLDVPRTRHSGDPLSDCVSARTRSVVELTNAAREDAGLEPVHCAPELAEVAQKHADDMCENDYFSHTSRDGRTMQDRVDQAGIDYRAIGENVALGQRTPEQVHQGWMGSPAHRDNILRPVFSRLGVGYASCGGRPIWVQNFAN